MKKLINIEYERKAYYNDGLAPECTEAFGDDYIDWDSELDGEPTLENILVYLNENEDVLSYTEDDVIDFSRAESLDETILSVLHINVMPSDEEDEDEESDNVYEDCAYSKKEIEAAYDRLYEEGIL